MVKKHRKLFYTLLFGLMFSQLITPAKLFSQTPVFVETFGTNSGACDQGTFANGFNSSNGTWVVTNTGVNDIYANEWYISATQPGTPVNSCAVPGCNVTPSYTNRTLHVGNVPNSTNAAALCPTGDCGAVYDPGGLTFEVQTNKRAESPSFSMPGLSQNLLVFNYIEVTDFPEDSDKVLVYFYDGTSWLTSPIADPPRTSICGVGSSNWTQFTVSLPVIPTTANVKIGFQWTNDNGGVGVSPSFAVDSIVVFNINIPTAIITASDTDICPNSCIDFFANSVPSATYDWVFTGSTTPTSSQQNPTSICYPSAGTFPVLLVITDGGNIDTATATITVNPCITPVANFAASDTTFCERSCATFTDLSTNAPTAWEWSFPGGTPSSSTSPSPPQICYDTPGIYDVTLIATNQFGSDTLVKTSYIQVDTCSLPIANYNSSPVSFCPLYCVSFTDNSSNGPITSYQWIFPGSQTLSANSPNPVICYAQEGDFDVFLIVSNQFGNDTLIDTSAVHVQLVQGAFVSADTQIVAGSSVQLNSGGGITYSWLPTDSLDDATIPDPTAHPTQTTTYTVSINDGTCVSKLTTTVTVLHDNKIFVANAFSPNGDGRNEYLFVRGNNFKTIAMTIFDRWGEKVFQTDNQLIGWDGTFKGQQLDPGVFTYVLTVTYQDRSIVTQTGSVTLVR